jgi:hypothetical protein
MEGHLSSHEEETGCVIFHQHSLTEGLTQAEIAPRPFREEWYRDGVQILGAKQPL